MELFLGVLCLFLGRFLRRHQKIVNLTAWGFLYQPSCPEKNMRIHSYTTLHAPNAEFCGFSRLMAN